MNDASSEFAHLHQWIPLDDATYLVVARLGVRIDDAGAILKRSALEGRIRGRFNRADEATIRLAHLFGSRSVDGTSKEGWASVDWRSGRCARHHLVDFCLEDLEIMVTEMLAVRTPPSGHGVTATAANVNDKKRKTGPKTGKTEAAARAMVGDVLAGRTTFEALDERNLKDLAATYGVQSLDTATKALARARQIFGILNSEE